MNLLDRQLGKPWKKVYPHLIPRCGEPIQGLAAFPNDGYIFGPTLISLHDLPEIPIEQIQSVDYLSCNRSCYFCEGVGMLFCQTCKILLCPACWEQTVATQDCAGNLFCNWEPEYNCPIGHPLCPDHMDECKICQGHFCGIHEPNHKYLVIGECKCKHMCLNCSKCQCTCDCNLPNILEIDQNSTPDLEQWACFAKGTLGQSEEIPRLCPKSFDLKNHLDACWQVHELLLETLIHDMIQEQEQEQEQDQDQDQDQNQVYLDVVTIFDSFEDPDEEDEDSEEPEELYVQTNGQDAVFGTLINVQSMAAGLAELLDQNDVARFLLLRLGNQIAMLCYWWKEDGWSLHRVGKEEELLELLESAHRAQEWLPAHFFKLKHPAIA